MSLVRSCLAFVFSSLAIIGYAVACTVSLVLPDFAVDFRESIELDRVAHETKIVATDEGSGHVRAMAFLKRALTNKRYMGGSFRLDELGSPA